MTDAAKAARTERVEAIERASLALGLGGRWSDGPEPRTPDKAVALRGPCGRCTHSVIWRRGAVGAPQVYCTHIGKYVPPDIEWCSDEKPVASTLSLEDMEKMAVLVDPREGPPGTNTYL